ncbi:unnamed protein product [Rotaria sordida]|uniref:Uncharacterized protein n=1 Tax=Rotaria sordida TaxID=392033 RepID=A0A814VF30_9BILA|nr:unnamed protein product [Rotaria sordida]CAF4073680.1 unnamed protein product [Rotaria sordida]
MSFLETFGALTLIYILVRLATFIYQILCPLRVDIKKFGEWALITGSTDGIGKAYAIELAKRGFNVILISRTKEKLEQVAKEIQTKYSNTQVKIISIDFTKDNSIYSRIREEIRGIDIGVLINNVGISYEYPESFDKIEENEKCLNNMIRCNVDSVANLTQIILPDMIKKRRGLIVNISSISGRRPTPLLGLYSGTKGFIDLFSRSLAAECISRGVYIQSLCPGYVVSKLSGIRKASLIAPTPEKFVASALDRITLPFTTGYWTHEIQEFIQSLLPEFLSNKIAMHVLCGVRAKALKKRNKGQ